MKLYLSCMIIKHSLNVWVDVPVQWPVHVSLCWEAVLKVELSSSWGCSSAFPAPSRYHAAVAHPALKVTEKLKAKAWFVLLFLSSSYSSDASPPRSRVLTGLPLPLPLWNIPALCSPPPPIVLWSPASSRLIITSRRRAARLFSFVPAGHINMWLYFQIVLCQTMMVASADAFDSS